MKTLLAGGVAVIALTLALPPTTAQADHHGYGYGAKDRAHGKWHGKWHGKRGRGDRKRRNHRERAQRKIRMIEALETFDADKDGSITQAEVDQMRADRLKAFDTDGDGMLSLAEYEALWLDAMRKRMVRRFQRHDSDGDGKITTEEFSERTKHMVLRRDRNEDGVLNMEDLKPRGRRGKRDGRRERREKDAQSE